MEKIKMNPRPQSELDVVKFEILQRLAYEHFLSVEENLLETLDRDLEKKLWEKKKVLDKASYRREVKATAEGRKRFLSRVKAYKTKVEDMQKIFERGGRFHESVADEAIEKMYTNLDLIFELGY